MRINKTCICENIIWRVKKIWRGMYLIKKIWHGSIKTKITFASTPGFYEFFKLIAWGSKFYVLKRSPYMCLKNAMAFVTISWCGAIAQSEFIFLMSWVARTMRNVCHKIQVSSIKYLNISISRMCNLLTIIVLTNVIASSS